MSDDLLTRRRPAAFAAAVLVLIVAAVGAVAFAVHQVAGPGAPVAVPTAIPIPSTTPTPSTSPTPSASRTPLPAPADRCKGLTFGPPLAPRDEPADVHKYSGVPATQIDTSRLYEATITTNRGVIVVCLDPQLAPKTVNNFVVLARNHFYDGLTWHRVVADFVIQGGDPTGSGSGGPGYQFADEPVKASYAIGALAMANSGPNTNGSQFFICIGSQCPPLPPSYNLFGTVVSGQDVADKIVQGDRMTTITVAESTT